MKESAIVWDDGYTEAGFVKGVPGLYPDVRFAFRPCIVEEQARQIAAAKKLDPVKVERYAATVIAEHIREWDVRGQHGLIAEITPSNVLRLKPHLYNRLAAIVLYGEPYDADPEVAPNEDSFQDVDLELEAELRRVEFGELREDAHAKN